MDFDFASLDPDPASSKLKRDLQDIIRWHERSSPRSRQRAIGPSEVGDPCERRIAYKIAGATAVNTDGDPWPAIVGTAIHGWLERAIGRYQREHGDQGWLTEARVKVDDMVSGSSDLFHIPTGTVVDWKTKGSDQIKKLHRGEPPSPGYITQINLYGLGHERAGREVKNVALVYLARSGWLNDCFVWYAPYDRNIAIQALDRLYRIGFQLIDLDIENHPSNFARVSSAPGDGCVWCPMFNKDMDPSTSASGLGCPGR